MRTYISYPPLPKTSGGMHVLARMAALLQAEGHEVVLVPFDAASGHSLASMAPGVPVAVWGQAVPGTEDVWLCPEGWPQLMLPGLRAGARTVVYVQNWAFVHASVPQGSVQLAELPVDFLAVSQPVGWYVEQVSGRRCAVARPGINTSRFYAASSPRPHKGGAVRVAWMPRKNKALAMQVQNFVQARCALGAVEWVAIHGKSPDEVAELLRSCEIFLASGFPEGCPLPPLEAMSCGCLVVGFGGVGGWDYMRQALTGGYEPWWPQRPDSERPWGGNGFFAADADTIAAGLALEHAVRLCRSQDADAQAQKAAVLGAAAHTAFAYSEEAQAKKLAALWAEAKAGTLFTAECRKAYAV